jgi:hypothetical protein
MASVKILVHQDHNQNEIQNAVIQNLASAPSSPVEGQFYEDTATHATYVWNGSAWRPVDAAKLTDGSIANTALTTNPLARANHTGTQTASTISDFDSQVRTSTLNQMAAPTADLSMNSHKLTGLSNGTLSSDAATYGQLQSAVQGFAWKQLPVIAASTANVTLATGVENGDVLDGITLTTGDRILLKNQTSGAENGIYVVNASGAPTRADDGDTTAELRNATVWVSQGTANADSAWTQTAEITTVGTTAQTWAQVGGGSSYSAGNGLTLTGSTFDVGAGTGIVSNANDVAIDPTVVQRKYTSAIGNGSLTSFTINHALNNQWATVQIFENAGSFNQVFPLVRLTDANNATVIFNVAPTTNQYRVLVTA